MLPHRPPFRLVDRLLSATESSATAIHLVTDGDPLVDGSLSAPLLLEALAQTAALMTDAGIGAHRGYLVAARDVKFEVPVRAGDTLLLSAVRTATMGALHRVQAQASVDGRVVVRGELTFAVEQVAS